MPTMKPTHDSRRIAAWRAREGEMRDLVERVSPAMFEAAAKRKAEEVSQPWRDLVRSMRAEVRAKARDRADSHQALSDEEVLGYQWSWAIGRVADMLEFLLKEIRRDIGVEEGASIASMLLVEKAMLQLQLELQDGGTKDGREDSEEQRFRTLQALRCLSPRFDGDPLRRFRALRAAEFCAKITKAPTDAEVETSVKNLREHFPEDDFDEVRQTEWFADELPMLKAVQARAFLGEVDERFMQLDPLLVLEEFSDADASAKGGRASEDGRVGPARALARLALTCGALGYEQADGEEFDRAVERARNNLHVTRARIRETIRSFPGQFPSDEEGA